MKSELAHEPKNRNRIGSSFKASIERVQMRKDMKKRKKKKQVLRPHAFSSLNDTHPFDVHRRRALGLNATP